MSHSEDFDLKTLDHPITEIYAVMAIDEKGNEGICALFGALVAVTSVEGIARMMLETASNHVSHVATLRLCKFSTKQILETRVKTGAN